MPVVWRRRHTGLKRVRHLAMALPLHPLSPNLQQTPLSQTPNSPSQPTFLSSFQASHLRTRTTFFHWYSSIKVRKSSILTVDCLCPPHRRGHKTAPASCCNKQWSRVIDTTRATAAVQTRHRTTVIKTNGQPCEAPQEYRVGKSITRSGPSSTCTPLGWT